MTPRQQSILIGAVVTGVFTTSYLNFINFLCCLGVIIGGAVATQQYVSRTGNPIASGDGAVLGALAGAGGGVLGSLFDRMLRPVGLDTQSISQDMMSGMMENMDGQQAMMDSLQGGGAGMRTFLMGMLFGVVVYAIFGAIGGAIGAGIFGERQSPDGQPGGSGSTV